MRKPEGGAEHVLLSLCGSTEDTTVLPLLWGAAVCTLKLCLRCSFLDRVAGCSHPLLLTDTMNMVFTQLKSKGKRSSRPPKVSQGPHPAALEWSPEALAELPISLPTPLSPAPFSWGSSKLPPNTPSLSIHRC